MFPATSLPVACGPAPAGPLALPSREAALIHALPVERAVTAMRRRPEGHLPVAAMAETAGLGHDHFVRVFREITGVSPSRFRRALRMRRATELLLRSELPVIDVCYEVGYASLGSFTASFTRLVGVSPGQLRRLPAAVGRAVAALPVSDRVGPEPPGGGASVVGRVDGAVADAWVFVGLFDATTPPRVPVVGTLLRTPGPFALAVPPTGTYRLQAASLPADGDPRALLLPGDSLRVGARPEPVRVRDGKVAGPTDVPLRAIGRDEPQTLLALPSLLPRWLDVARRGHR